MGKLLHLKTSEKKLVEQCRKGKTSAQRQLYQQFSAQMFGVCRRYVKTREDAEEVLSNGFVKVFKNLDRFRGEGALGAWIRSIMVREALNYIRYQKNIYDEVDEERQAEFGMDSTQEQYNEEHLLQMITELPVGYQTVFNLYAIEGYNHREIGEMLEISENTSKSQLSKARKLLQQKLGEEELMSKQV